MNSVQNKVSIVGAVLLAILNGFAGLNIGMPSWADAQGVNLLSAAVLAVAALVFHILGKDQAPPAA